MGIEKVECKKCYCVHYASIEHIVPDDCLRHLSMRLEERIHDMEHRIVDLEMEIACLAKDS